MNFIVYSQIREENLHSSLGLPEYSYYIVLKGFLPVLKELGQVHIVKDPEKEVDCIYDACRKKNEDCVFITFSPPHKSTTGLRCPTIGVLAWEFDTIPNEVWDDNPKNDWRVVLSDHGRLIVLSQYSAQSVKKAMGSEFPVVAIPVPVWDAFEKFRNQAVGRFSIRPVEISMKGNIVDSRNYCITPDIFDPHDVSDSFRLENYSGEKLLLGFSKTDEFSAYLGGFYEPEVWGSWSRLREPWVLLPRRIRGTVQIKITACGYANNVNKDIFVSMGDEKKRIRLRAYYTDIQVIFHPKKPVSILQFSGLDLTAIPDAQDRRSMGIGLRSIEMTGQSDGEAQGAVRQEDQAARPIKLDGVVYASVFNPIDGRKNWKDILTAFCTVFQDVEDATLVLKMTHNALSSFLGKLHLLMQQLAPFKCRILALHGYLEPGEYEKLIAATDYYINASRSEGLCLPLMEFMACGKPALSPDHTAMADYMDSSSSFIVDSSLEPTVWPHDSRPVFRAMYHRINWESLVNAYQQSYQIAKNQPDTYGKMAQAAMSQIKTFASHHVVKDKLQSFLTATL